MSERKVFRENSTTEMRTCSPYHHIDPGFINRRKIFSVFGKPFIDIYEKHHSEKADHLSQLRNDHLLVNMCMELCNKFSVKSLAKSLIEIPDEGQLICSTEKFEGNENVWNDIRCSN